MIAFLLILISGTQSQTPLDNYPGFFPHHLGPAYVTTSKISFLYYINQEPLTQQLKKITDTYKIAYSRVIANDDGFINKTLIPRLLDINGQITSVKQMYNNLQTGVNHRQKRGLIDLGGSIAKTLFGTLDANDGKVIYESLNNLQENQQTLQLGLNKQVELYNDLTKEFNATIEIINSDLKLRNN